MNSITNQLRRLRRDTSGQFALMTAILSIPLLIGVGYAVDQSRLVSQRSALASAVDAAALAAVMPAQMNEQEREDYAREMFFQNYSSQFPVTVDVKATPERVDLFAESQVPTLFSGIVGRDQSGVRENASAIVTREDVICVLALDPKGPKSIEFKDSAQFISPACSVQANSTNNIALRSTTPRPPTAKSFCTGGGSQGSFYPYVKANCRPVEDPYKDLVVPDAADKCDEKKNVEIVGDNEEAGDWGEVAFAQGNGNGNANGRQDRDDDDDDGVNGPPSSAEELVPSNALMSPGIYCKGIRIDGANVRLKPGVYHVWGDLHITRNANLVGDGVTFLLKGKKNRLIIEDGAIVRLRAPSEGLTKGLVFWQAYLDMRKYVRGQKTPPPRGVVARSEINSGGGLQITGTAYFPNHELVVTSSNSVASQAPATSFIAYRLKFAGRANLQVNVDHEKGGIPPLLPRSDEGARLIE